MNPLTKILVEKTINHSASDPNIERTLAQAKLLTNEPNSTIQRNFNPETSLRIRTPKNPAFLSRERKPYIWPFPHHRTPCASAHARKILRWCMLWGLHGLKSFHGWLAFVGGEQPDTWTILDSLNVPRMLWMGRYSDRFSASPPF